MRPFQFLKPGGLLLLVGAVLLAGCGGDSSDNDEIAALGDVFAVMESGRLVSFRAATPDTFTSSHVIAGVDADEIVAIDFRPANSELYALTRTGTEGRLYTLNLRSGRATLATALTVALDGDRFGMDFNAVTDRLRIVSNTGQNLRVDVDTGQTVADTPLSRAGISGAAYTNSFAEACGTRLFFLDVSGRFARLASTADPNQGVVTNVGSPLSFEAPDAVNGFEIVTSSNGTNGALAAVNVTGGQISLYAIDLATGVDRQIGPVGTGLIPVRGISARPPRTAPAQIGELFAVTESNRLLSFNRTSPEKLCTNNPITGLGGAFQVVGIDFRPTTGILYALGREGGVANLYTVNPVTAAATIASTLEADAGDASAPYEALDGVNFGMDFEPTATVPLRIVSDTGQNLRVTNPATGSTFTDDALNIAAVPARATAAAYTNSIAGAGSTRLFVIDELTDRLYRQEPPDSGDLTLVGGLGSDITGVNGFDISARDNAGLVANHGPADASSTLGSINLATGALTPIGTIGGGERVRGLTVRPPKVTLFGLTTADRLVSFAPHAPETVTDIALVEPLTASEVLRSMDFRPADGRLYVTTGILYTVDLVTGEVAFVGEMAPPQAPRGDCAGGFNRDVLDEVIGFDFDPVADRLRVVGADDRQNLRVNPEIDFVTRPFAETCVDTPLGPGTPRVIASAYSSNFLGAEATTLYGIDAAALSLVRQGNPSPNDGQLAAVGPLNIGDIGDPAGFDIAGINDEIVLAALAVGGVSNLYRIDLATGAATQIGSTPIGGASPLTLKGLAIRVE